MPTIYNAFIMALQLMLRGLPSKEYEACCVMLDSISKEVEKELKERDDRIDDLTGQLDTATREHEDHHRHEVALRKDLEGASSELKKRYQEIDELKDKVDTLLDEIDLNNEKYLVLFLKTKRPMCFDLVKDLREIHQAYQSRHAHRGLGWFKKEAEKAVNGATLMVFTVHEDIHKNMVAQIRAFPSYWYVA